MTTVLHVQCQTNQLSLGDVVTISIGTISIFGRFRASDVCGHVFWFLVKDPWPLFFSPPVSALCILVCVGTWKGVSVQSLLLPPLFWAFSFAASFSSLSLFFLLLCSPSYFSIPHWRFVRVFFVSTTSVPLLCPFLFVVFCAFTSFSSSVFLITLILFLFHFEPLSVCLFEHSFSLYSVN